MDKYHPADAPLKTTFGFLGSHPNRPAILSLRVCKSPVTVGVPQIENLGLEENWSSIGKYATVSFLPP